MSRRKAVWRFLAGAGAVLGAGKLAKADGNNACFQFCQATSLGQGMDFGLCMAASAQCPEGQCAFLGNGSTPICVPFN